MKKEKRERTEKVCPSESRKRRSRVYRSRVYTLCARHTIPIVYTRCRKRARARLPESAVCRSGETARETRNAPSFQIGARARAPIARSELRFPEDGNVVTIAVHREVEEVKDTKLLSRVARVCGGGRAGQRDRNTRACRRSSSPSTVGRPVRPFASRSTARDCTLARALARGRRF